MEKITLLTKHRKAAAIYAALANCGFKICTVDSFNTDQLGTFTGERSRSESLRDTALHKAKLAAQLGNTRYGLGSVGSFGLDPLIGMTAWNTEVLACWDAVEQHAVYAQTNGPETNYSQKYVHAMDDALQFMSQCKFPSHGIIVGKPGESDFYKNVNTVEEMTELLALLLPQSGVWLETDMRAHRNPTRMRMIERCSKRLAMNLLSVCTACNKAGFIAVAQIPGAACESCGAATGAARAELFSCASCGHEEERKLSSLAPTSRCNHCNPLLKRRAGISAPRQRDSQLVQLLR